MPVGGRVAGKGVGVHNSGGSSDVSYASHGVRNPPQVDCPPDDLLLLDYPRSDAVDCLPRWLRWHASGGFNEEVIWISIGMSIAIVILITIALCYLARQRCKKRQEISVRT